jgi:hypothetical protein
MKPPSTFGSVANSIEMSGSESTSGSSQGSEPFARYASESRKTGVRYLSAIRTASIAASKQLPGVEAATTGTGASAFRPNMTASRSACSGFVGIPVDGPARWMSRIRSGSSSVTASPIVSCLRITPGPLEVQTPSAPPKLAPSAAPTAAISSSAWNVRTPKFLCRARSWRMSEAGVIGYAERKSGSFDRTLAATRPSASAWFPVMPR